MIEILDKLHDLRKQALEENSHYYTASTLNQAIDCIKELQKTIFMFGDTDFDGTYFDKCMSAINTLEKWGLRKDSV